LGTRHRRRDRGFGNNARKSDAVRLDLAGLGFAFDESVRERDVDNARGRVDTVNERPHERYESTAFELEQILPGIMPNRRNDADPTAAFAQTATDQIVVEILARCELHRRSCNENARADERLGCVRICNPLQRGDERCLLLSNTRDRHREFGAAVFKPQARVESFTQHVFADS
jgi:hypothetical protein